jgi:hypothetical protein
MVCAGGSSVPPRMPVFDLLTLPACTSRAIRGFRGLWSSSRCSRWSRLRSRPLRTRGGWISARSTRTLSRSRIRRAWSCTTTIACCVPLPRRRQPRRHPRFRLRRRLLRRRPYRRRAPCQPGDHWRERGLRAHPLPAKAEIDAPSRGAILSRATRARISLLAGTIRCPGASDTLQRSCSYSWRSP